MTQAASQTEGTKQGPSSGVVKPGAPPQQPRSMGGVRAQFPTDTPVGGRVPLPGDIVWFWYSISQGNADSGNRVGDLKPFAAMLLIEDARGGAGRGVWHIRGWRTEVARVYRSIHFSETPVAGCWSWRPEPKAVKS